MFYNKNLKCVLLLHLFYSVQGRGVRFYNPPIVSPDVIKLTENHGELVFEKLKGKEERDFLKDLTKSEFLNQVSVLNDIKEGRIDGKFDGFHNDLTYRSPFENLLKKYAQNKKLRGFKRILVKRTVPHGYKSPKYEYDNNFKTIYRPIARFPSNLKPEDFQTRNDNLNMRNTIFVRNDDDNELEPGDDKVLKENLEFRRHASLRTEPDDITDLERIFVSKIGRNFRLDKNFNDNHLLNPFQIEFDDDGSPDTPETKKNRKVQAFEFQDYTRDKKHRNKKLHLRMSRPNFKIVREYDDDNFQQPFNLNIQKYDEPDESSAELLDILDKIRRLYKIVRSPRLKRKVLKKILDLLEDIYGLRSGVVQIAEEEDVENEQEVSSVVNRPIYHDYSYWTYDTGVLEDDCPGEQAMIGNVCSWTPPH